MPDSPVRLRLFFASLCIVFTHAPFAPAAPDRETEFLRASVVKVEVVTQRPDYYSPWRNFDLHEQSGTAFVIEGNRILTSAHLVSDAKYLELFKDSSDVPWRADVSFIGHDCDLAILTVRDASFFRDMGHLMFGTEMPPIQSTVLVCGFPAGGQRISVTRGVVSRIDYSRYTHSAVDAHLVMQIDAALNPGNSGGPVIRDGRVVGVAFQVREGLENAGHVVPLTVIRHFLADIADGRYDGYPELGLVSGKMLNPAMRRLAGLPEGSTGVIVYDFMRGAAAESVLRPHDVLVSVDGHPIRNDGSILVDGERYSLEETIERKQVGDEVVFGVLRGGKSLSCTFRLNKVPVRMDRARSYDKQPDYFISGGFVFQPLSRGYLETWSGNCWDTADKRLLYYFECYFSDGLYLDNPEPVVMTRVLPAAVNRYSSSQTNLVVRRVNGRPVKGLRDVVEAFGSPLGGYHLIEYDGAGGPDVLDAAATAAANQAILEEYGIPADRHLSALPGGGRE